MESQVGLWWEGSYHQHQPGNQPEGTLCSWSGQGRFWGRKDPRDSFHRLPWEGTGEKTREDSSHHSTLSRRGTDQVSKGF